MAAASSTELAEVWRWLVNETRGYSPLYTAIVEAMADDDEVLALVLEAPPESQYPLMALAAVHDLVLDDQLPELAATSRRRHVGRRRAAVVPRRDPRTTQRRARGAGDPLHPDQRVRAGRARHARASPRWPTSSAPSWRRCSMPGSDRAGLNLLYDRYRLELGDDVLGEDAESPVVCPCAISGTPPGPDRDSSTSPCASGSTGRRWTPPIHAAGGGCWRRRRPTPVASSAPGRRWPSPPPIRRIYHAGDLVEDLGPTLASIDVDGPVCVLTSWAVGYLTGEQRTAFVGVLADAARDHDGTVAWAQLGGPHRRPRRRAGGAAAARLRDHAVDRRSDQVSRHVRPCRADRSRTSTRTGGPSGG